MSINNFKAKVVVTLRPAILDVQGKTVENALGSMSYEGISNVRIGKFITLDIAADTKDEAEGVVRKAAEQLLSNPIVEDFVVEIS